MLAARPHRHVLHVVVGRAAGVVAVMNRRSTSVVCRLDLATARRQSGSVPADSRVSRRRCKSGERDQRARKAPLVNHSSAGVMPC